MYHKVVSGDEVNDIGGVIDGVAHQCPDAMRQNWEWQVTRGREQMG